MLRSIPADAFRLRAQTLRGVKFVWDHPGVDIGHSRAAEKRSLMSLRLPAPGTRANSIKIR